MKNVLKAILCAFVLCFSIVTMGEMLFIPAGGPATIFQVICVLWAAGVSFAAITFGCYIAITQSKAAP